MGLILAIVHFLSEKLHLLKRMHRMKFVSFSGGVFITYIFLHLFPTLFWDDITLSRVSLVFLLIGFSTFHLLEKYIYRHGHADREEVKRELKEAHAVAFFAYHFIVGIIFVNILERLGTLDSILFFIPLAFITAVSSLSLKGIHGRVRQNFLVKLFLSISTLLGIVTALTFTLPTMLDSALLGYVIGALLFIVIVDSIPRERRGEPMFFILGIVLYSFLIGITWIF